MPSHSTFLLFVENAFALNKQKHTIIGPQSARRKTPKEEGNWASYEIVINGELIVSLRERGPHLKTPSKTLAKDGDPISILGVPMVIGKSWADITTRSPAVLELIKAMKTSQRAAA